MKKYFNLRPVPAYIITSVFVALVCGSTVLMLVLRGDGNGGFTWLAILPAALFLIWTVSAAVVFYKMHRRYNNVFGEILSTFPKEDVDAFMEFTARNPEPEEVSRWVCGKLLSYERARFNNMAALSGVSMSREMFWRISEKSMRLDFGDYWARTYGIADIGRIKDIRLILSPATRAEFNGCIEKITEEAGTGFSLFGKLELSSAKTVSVQIQGRSVKNLATGEIVCMGSVCDLEIEKKLSEQYKTERTKTRFLVSASPDVLYEVDVPKNRLKSLNPKRARELLNMGDMKDFDGQRRPYWALIHPDDREGFIDRFFNYDHMTIMPEQKMLFEYRVKNKEGDYIWVEHQAQAISSKDGKVTRIIGRISDINERKRNALKQRTSIDALTGAFLRTSVAREFENPVYNENTHCVVLFNINGFHFINNQYGYDVGDTVLRELVTVLWENQQGRCAVGRLEDDTFVVAMMEVSEKHTPQKVVDRVLERFERPLNVNGKVINIALSAASSGTLTGRSSFDEGFDKADKAMKESKKNATVYTNVFTEYTDSLQPKTED